MSKWIRLVATLVMVVFLLTGCSGGGFGQFLEDIFNSIAVGTATSFEDMEYVRPDVDAFEATLATTMEMAKTETKVKTLMDSVFSLYNMYYDFYTNYSLANIHYCMNMTDIYWNDEYSWCLENATRIDSGLDQLLYALADSPLREKLEADEYFGEGFFDAYDGESIWDETFTALMNQEADLMNEYYDLEASAAGVTSQAEFFNGYGYEMEQLFVELILIRQQIAEYAGYDSYADFAYEFYFYRDYTPAQAEAYVQQIAQELVPLYKQLDYNVWQNLYTETTEDQVYSYLEDTVSAIGGMAQYAFNLLDAAKLYDITYSENKYGASFESFLYNYNEPFIFMCPTGYAMDQLTLVHEFGHFCNDYAVNGSIVGVDVAEVFSQGFEYLSIIYNTNGQTMAAGKMADSLCVFVEQSAYAAFELAIYQLEDVTVENVRAAFANTCKTFGMGDLGIDVRSYVTVPHFFIAPMYVISYVVSNDVALQIYQAEQAEAGSGVKLWEDGLFTMQEGLMGFVNEMGFVSPFDEGRVASIRDTFKSILG